MTNRVPEHPSSVVCLSVEALREDWIDNGNLTAAQRAVLECVPDADLKAALDKCVTDYFWSAFDDVRSDATQLLLRELGLS